MVPSMIKKKKKSSKDFNIKAFVAILFLVIVFLIGYAYIMYNQKVLAKLYFDRIKFDKEMRTIRVFDAKDQTVISGRLGLMPIGSRPFRCLDDTNLDPGTLCLEWDGLARLYVSASNLTPTIPCYHIRWQALGDSMLPTDCYDVDEEEDHWYGGGLTRDAKWPLEKDSFDFSAFITGDARVQQFGNAMKRYFINSRGVAIKVDDKTPLYVSMNRNGSRQFCLKAQNDDFAFVNRLTPRPELAYKICTSDNMKLLHKHMTQQSLWDGVKEEENDLVILMLEEPVWQIQTEDASKMTQQTISDFTEEVVALGFLRLGHVLVNEFWQKNIGDFTLEKERFPTLSDMVDLLHRRGFRILFTIQPFISTNSPNFEDAVDKKLLIYERLSERSIPALTRYKSSASAGVIDMTNNRSIPWLLEKLDKVVTEHKVDGFFIDFGTAYNMPHYYQCSKSLDNPDQYKNFFTNALNGELMDLMSFLICNSIKLSILSEGMVKVIGTSSANTVPRPPTFLSLPPVNSSYQGLQSVITAALSYGILGFPFILPGPIGGDYYFEGKLPKSLSFYSLGKPPLPEEELYIRWMQLATFLPVIRFTHLPSEYKSEFVMDVAKELMSIRQKVVIPILKKYFQEAMDEALPLIRPLWMLDSQDPACLYVHDEFSVGIELIVAPILSRGQYSREGEWRWLYIYVEKKVGVNRMIQPSLFQCICPLVCGRMESTDRCGRGADGCTIIECPRIRWRIS